MKFIKYNKMLVNKGNIRAWLRNNLRRLQIDFTYKCNTSCKNCIAHFINRSSPDIELSRAKEILSDFIELCGNSDKELLLSSDAEPTCYKDLPELLKYIDSKFNHSLIYYDTNCIRLTDELLDTLKSIKNNKVKICISMWGYDENSFYEMHNLSRSTSDLQFKVINKNIRKYLSINNDVTRISLSFPYTTDDYRLKILEYAKNTVSEFGYSYDIKYGGFDDNPNINVISIQQRVHYKKDGNSYYDGSIVNMSPRTTCCNVCYKFINITNSGNVYPCVNVNNTESAILGNVFTDRLIDIVYNDKSLKIFNKILNCKFPYNECTHCSLNVDLEELSNFNEI